MKKVYKLSEIASIYSGITPSTKNEDYYIDGNIPWITPKDLSNYNSKYISKGERSVTEKALKETTLKVLPKNTVLLSSRAPIGYVAIASNELTTNQGFKSFVCNEKVIKPDYLYYFLKSKKDYIETFANGTTFKELSLTAAKNLEILLPTIEEQEDIINKINTIDELLEINNIIKTDLLIMGENYYKIYIQIKPTEDYEIGNVVEIIGGGTPNTQTQEYWNNGDILWYTPTDITRDEGIFLINSSRKITKFGLDNSSAKIIPAKSLMITSRATIGEIGINIEEATTNQGFINIVPNTKIPLSYLYFWAKTNKEKFIAISNGSTFKEINKKDFKKTPIKVPEEFQEFIDWMDPIFEKIENIALQNAKLKDLKDILIKKLIL